MATRKTTSKTTSRTAAKAPARTVRKAVQVPGTAPRTTAPATDVNDPKDARFTGTSTQIEPKPPLNDLANPANPSNDLDKAATAANPGASPTGSGAAVPAAETGSTMKAAPAGPDPIPVAIVQPKKVLAGYEPAEELPAATVALPHDEIQQRLMHGAGEQQAMVDAHNQRVRDQRDADEAAAKRGIETARPVLTKEGWLVPEPSNPT